MFECTIAITLYAFNFDLRNNWLFSTKRSISYVSFVNDCTTRTPDTASSTLAFTPAIFSYMERHALPIFMLLYVIKAIKIGTIIKMIIASGILIVNIIQKAPRNVIIAIKKSSGP